MPRCQKHIDPYLAMMKQLERRAVGYGLIAVIVLASALFAATFNSDGMGNLAPAVEQIRRMISLGLLCACGVSCALSLWFIGRYVYFAKWPERFE